MWSVVPRRQIISASVGSHVAQSQHLPSILSITLQGTRLYYMYSICSVQWQLDSADLTGLFRIIVSTKAAIDKKRASALSTIALECIMSDRPALDGYDSVTRWDRISQTQRAGSRIICRITGDMTFFRRCLGGAIKTAKVRRAVRPSVRLSVPPGAKIRPSIKRSTPPSSQIK